MPCRNNLPYKKWFTKRTGRARCYDLWNWFLSSVALKAYLSEGARIQKWKEAHSEYHGQHKCAFLPYILCTTPYVSEPFVQPQNMSFVPIVNGFEAPYMNLVVVYSWFVLETNENCMLDNEISYLNSISIGHMLKFEHVTHTYDSKRRSWCRLQGDRGC